MLLLLLDLYLVYSIKVVSYKINLFSKLETHTRILIIAHKRDGLKFKTIQIIVAIFHPTTVIANVRTRAATYLWCY